MEYSADDDLQADIEIQNSSCLYFIQFLPADLPFRPQRQGAMSGGIHAVLFLGRHDAPLAASAFNEVNDVLWDFLDGFTVLAWLCSCKTARTGHWWVSRARRAKKMFQEVQDYLDSGKVVLPGFGLAVGRADKVKVRLLPLNPAREIELDGSPGSRNWELHRQFCDDNPRLSHFNYTWLIATTRAEQDPWWHQFDNRDGQGTGEALLAVHEGVLRLVMDTARYAPWDILTCPDGYIRGFAPPALMFLGVAYGNFSCALQAVLED